MKEILSTPGVPSVTISSSSVTSLEAGMAPEPAPPPTFDKFWPKTRRGLSSMVWKKNQDPKKIMLYSPKKRTSRRQIQGYFQNPGNLPFQPKPLKPTPEVPFLILPVPIRLLIFDLSPFVLKKPGKKVCKTTTFRCYQCFSLRLLLFLA